jgi:hypothetical protein
MKKGDGRRKIDVDGFELLWQIRHLRVHDNIEGPKGISVSVAQVPDRTRELIVDFPFNAFGREHKPKEEDLIQRLVVAIRAAIEGGWDPEARGRTVRYKVPAPEETAES